MKRPKRIAVLGGGMGALSFVWELTSKPGWQDDWDVTVYNMGWRLGGKGASGRQLPTQRIVEHGLHILSGSYDHTWRVMKACYEELGRAPGDPLATWQDAFQPHDLFVLEDTRSGKRFQWVIPWPRNLEEPGAVGDDTPWDHLVSTLEWLGEQILHELGGELFHPPSVSEAASVAERIAEAFEGKTADLIQHAKNVFEGKADDHVSLTRTIADAASIPFDLSCLHVARELGRNGDAVADHAHVHQGLSKHLEEFRTGLLSRVEGMLNWITDLLYQIVIAADLAVAAAIGMVADGLVLPPHDWFKVDALDFKDWLRKYGACEAAVASAPVRVTYEMIFAQKSGLGAGTALHFMLNLCFEYRGAFSWKMQAGMGDTIFAPLYLVLKRRGVKFAFFQRVDELRLSEDKTFVKEIVVGQQAIPDGEYDPLVPVPWGGDPEKILPSWPASPIYDRLVDGHELADSGQDLEDFWTKWKDPLPPKVLRCGEDFEFVVLAIGVGAMPFLAKQLMDASPGFGTMANAVKTIQTSAVQVWMAKDLPGLGWTLPSPILGTYQEPFTTWADMSQLMTAEDWPPGAGVANISYLCDIIEDLEPIPPQTDHGYPARQNARVKELGIEWLDKWASGLWPKTAAATGFDWNVLVDLGKHQGKARFDAQFWHAPVNPSERYVLSVPGSAAARLRENQAGFANVLLAGDWIKTAWSAGFLEAATRSGIQAWQALTGATEPDVGLPRESGAFDPDFDARGVDMVRFDGNFVPGLPYTLDGTTMYTFVLSANQDALAELCNKFLNRGTGDLVWRPLGPFAAYVCAEVECICSKNPPSWTPEKDFGFWIPVVGGTVENGTFHPKQAAFFIPYLWVDTSLAVTVGREVQGFPKGMGILGAPTGPKDEAAFSVQGWAVAKYSDVPNDDSRWALRPIARAYRKDESLLGELVVAWQDLVQLAEGLLSSMTKMAFGPGGDPKALLELFEAMVEDALHGTVPMIFLKEFPSVTNTTLASYQALVEAPNVVQGGIKGAGPLLGDYRVQIHTYDSCRLAEHLGIALDGDEARSLMQFFVKFDFVLGPGRVLHVFT